MPFTFFHPDYTLILKGVGTLKLNKMSDRRLRSFTESTIRLVGFTTGQEFHPALKIILSNIASDYAVFFIYYSILIFICQGLFSGNSGELCSVTIDVRPKNKKRYRKSD
jgi:hypothetical protein